MTDSDGWLERYAEINARLTSPALYWVAVPLVVTGVVGLLWSLPVPEQFYEISPLLNWGTAFLMAAAVYYFIISLPIAIGMLPFILGVAAIQLWLEQSLYSHPHVAAGLVTGGVIGLWLGHRDQPGVRPLLTDLQLIMIGPAWLLSVLYRRLGIPF
jgi:peptidoglycan/LPS O-acetylase OafA/YrhL